MKNVHIPTPCSENWNEMSSNEKGAFCKKCAHDVYDFTNKSADEIRNVLTLNLGARVCGRINSTQLENLNTDFSAWQINNKQSFQRAWVFTLFVVFGMTLFSCEEEEEFTVDQFQKLGQVVLTKSNDARTIEVETSKVENAETKKVEVKSTEKNVLPLEEPAIAVQYEVEHEILGMMDYREEEPNAMEEVVIVGNRPIVVEEYEYITMGDMAFSPRFEEYLEEDGKRNAKNRNSVEITAISGLMYPNPAANESTLKVTAPGREKVEIELIGLNGQRIRTIYSGKLKKGETEFPMDISDLETGLYIVIIYSGDKKATVKFTKI